MLCWLIGSLLTAVVSTTALLVSRLVWLAGLKEALSNSHPHQRPAIIRAYATCQPVAARTRDPGPRDVGADR
ncbi:hypothetical protein ACFFX1_08680 [Dactylosporangium sucinum]|uniref:Uncharacterized protein n=1 Tax=Dactylosporangium sucinum TaxID=1424081 RepID=A0A917U1P0_9ACTN|nr:hypothetical protein [Dactylosporangium sucinum]GGM51248.1 hypothetical protein GCM10007977_061290 [Dactylosporangium sucinum]